VALCNKSKCIYCGQVGASLGCTRPGCRVAVHIPCSMDQGWITDNTTFQAACPKCATASGMVQTTPSWLSYLPGRVTVPFPEDEER